MREIIITANEAEQRLDKFLAKYLNEAPKSFFYKMLRKKNIVLNGKKASGDEKLKIGDSVKLFLAEETIEKFSSVKIRRTKVKLDIIYEDNHVLFINKPSGMLSQKATVQDVSVVEHVISYLLNTKQLDEKQLQTFKPSICNRLDRNTSGLITAGKSFKGLQELSKCFKERTMGKYYLAMVAGSVERKQHLKGYLLKDEKTNQVRISDKEVEGGSYIETEYKPLWSSEEMSLLEVHLITGKTHQIRAHLAFTGHGIVGDTKYGNPQINQKFKKSHGIEHQMLHAYRLSFPKGAETLEELAGKEFIAPLPLIYKTLCMEKQKDYEYLEFQRS